MKENNRCSILFHLLGLGGKGQRTMGRPVSWPIFVFPLPQAQTCAIAAAGIGSDQQALGTRIGLHAHGPPPAANTPDGELRCVVIYSHAHPTRIPSDIVDSI